MTTGAGAPNPESITTERSETAKRRMRRRSIMNILGSWFGQAMKV